ncbi:unnamed protein product, partial [Rotaria sp. Silwood2]
MHNNPVYSGHDTGNNERYKWLSRRRIRIIGASFIIFIILAVGLPLLLKFVILVPKQSEIIVITTIASTTSSKITTTTSSSTTTTTITTTITTKQS